LQKEKVRQTNIMPLLKVAVVGSGGAGILDRVTPASEEDFSGGA
jgi:hypothetical protein